MLTLSGTTRIFLAAEPVDMRNGFDGLAARVLGAGLDLYAGHIFVFVSKRRKHLKALAWDRNGLVVLFKRIEKGKFRLPEVPAGERTVAIDATELAMLLDGIDVRGVRRSASWSPRRTGIDAGIVL